MGWREGVWGATWDGVSLSGRQNWQAPWCFLCTESSGTSFPTLLAPGYDLYLPSPAPSSRSQRVWREPGQRLRENEDISQMACPSGCVLAGRAWGEWGWIPVYPLNILSMFPPWPQNHSNVSLPPLRLRTQGLQGDRPAARAQRRHRCQGRGLGQLGAQSAGPGPVLTMLLTALAWPGHHTQSCFSRCGCPLGEDGQLALPSSWETDLSLPTVA